MKKGVYAGSFDPITNGHLWMIKEGSKLFDELVVAIGINPDKKYDFSFSDRKLMLEETLKDIPNAKIDDFENKFLVDYTKSINADYILRGIRNEKDYGYERGMRNINSDLSPGVSTIFLMPPREISEVSSSLVKGLVGPEGWENAVEKYIPKTVYKKLLKKFKGYSSNLKSLWKKIDAKGDPEKVYDNLANLYWGPNREYHNLIHVGKCLEEFEQIKDLSKNANAVEAAIWFHDAVYNTKNKDNEEKSVELAWNICRNSIISLGITQKINDLVMATKHSKIPKDLDEKIMVDIDLSILGKPKEEFEKYNQEIRSEYSGVPKKVFNKKRAEILQEFLKRPQIYSTDFFRQKYEEQARSNLKNLLTSLK